MDNGRTYTLCTIPTDMIQVEEHKEKATMLSIDQVILKCYYHSRLLSKIDILFNDRNGIAYCKTALVLCSRCPLLQDRMLRIAIGWLILIN